MWRQQKRYTVRLYENAKNLSFSDLKGVYCVTVLDRLIIRITYNREKDLPYSEYVQFEENSDGSYIYCNDQAVWDEINNTMLCPTCQGAGQIADGNGIPCGICGGTGQMYVPNLYYDAVTG